MMHISYIKDTIVIFAVTLITMTGITGCAFAAVEVETDVNNMPQTVEITFEHIVKGNEDKVGTDTFILQTSDLSAPMPDGTVTKANGIIREKKLSTRNIGTLSFGEMTVMKPEVYDYTIYREKNNKKNVKKDYNVYKIKLIALNTGEVYIVTEPDSTGHKSDLIYKDTVHSIFNPQTGQEIDPILMGMIIAMLLTSLLYILESYRRHRLEKGEKYANNQ